MGPPSLKMYPGIGIAEVISRIVTSNSEVKDVGIGRGNQGMNVDKGGRGDWHGKTGGRSGLA